MLANIFWDSFSSWARWRLTQTGQHCWSADVGQNVGRFAPPAPSIILRILAMKICMAPWSWAGFLQPRSHNFCLAFWIYDGAVLSFYQKLWKSPPKRRMAFMWITLLLTERYLINTAPLFWLLSIIIAVPRGGMGASIVVLKRKLNQILYLDNDDVTIFLRWVYFYSNEGWITRENFVW